MSQSRRLPGAWFVELRTAIALDELVAQEPAIIRRGCRSARASQGRRCIAARSRPARRVLETSWAACVRLTPNTRPTAAAPATLSRGSAPARACGYHGPRRAASRSSALPAVIARPRSRRAPGPSWRGSMRVFHGLELIGGKVEIPAQRDAALGRGDQRSAHRQALHLDRHRDSPIPLPDAMPASAIKRVWAKDSVSFTGPRRSRPALRLRRPGAAVGGRRRGSRW